MLTLVVLELSVDSIGLTVQEVRTHVSLDANAVNFVQITTGVDVGIRKVQLSISGGSRRRAIVSAAAPTVPHRTAVHAALSPCVGPQPSPLPNSTSGR